MFSLIHHSVPAKRKVFLSKYEATPSPRHNSKKEYETYQSTPINWESALHIPVHTHLAENSKQVWVLGHIQDLYSEANPTKFLLKHYSDKGYEGRTSYSVSLSSCFIMVKP